MPRKSPSAAKRPGPDRWPPKPRLDNLLVDLGLADTRSRAKALILAGDVLVNGQRETHAGHQVGERDEVTLRQKPRFVSRGGEKLDHALEAFDIDVSGMIAADLGASTGGFTDCLLKRDAARVYAVDVGHGQIDLRVRTTIRAWWLWRKPTLAISKRCRTRLTSW